jgi:cell division septation protein DedD
MPNNKQPNPRIMRKKFWIWAGVLLSLSAWMFLLGVLVGRGTAPLKFNINKLEHRLLAKRRAADQKEKEMVSGNIQSGPDKTKLDFYETLKKNQTEEKLPPSKTKVQRKQPPGSVSVGSTSTSSIPGLYTVQIASLRSKDSAQSIATNLIKKGFDAFIATSTSRRSGTWHRVRIGNFKKKSDAEKMAKKMKSKSYKPIVVRQE